VNAATNSTVDTAFQNFRILDNTYLQFQMILSHVSACEHVTIVFELQENGGEFALAWTAEGGCPYVRFAQYPKPSVIVK